MKAPRWYATAPALRTYSPSMDKTTSKGTIQGYNGIASVDKKHQIIIDAQVFGSGQEQHTLQPVLEAI
ncbi:MAG: hypothetical protein KAT06_11390 [Gammaproteobacteria bacterium]|nr:hypothetical protein [Gammaproteobacteria bacterium]